MIGRRFKLRLNDYLNVRNFVRPPHPTQFSKTLWITLLNYVRSLAQKLSQVELNFIQIRKTERPHENCQIYHRTEDQPPHARFPPPKAGFCCGIRNLGVLSDGCQLFKGGTTGIHHDAAHNNFAVRDLHTSARTSESFGRSESGGHEPDHQSTQSAPVPTQCRRRAKFRSALRVRASNHYHKACEIGRTRRGC